MLKIVVDSFSEVWYTNGRRKNSTRVNRLVTWRYEFTIIAARFLDENSAWPHLWPSTASDYVETVLTRASESTVFGLKSTIKSTKVVKKRWRICSGTSGRSPISASKKRGNAVKKRGNESFALQPHRSKRGLTTILTRIENLIFLPSRCGSAW